MTLHQLKTRRIPQRTLYFDCIGYTQPVAGTSPILKSLKLVTKTPKRRRTLETVPHPRYLGLDVGNRRIGVAVSDELGLTAQPVLTLERRRTGSGTSRDDLRSLARLARKFAVAGIVVGNPLHLSGESSPQALRTQTFAAELGELTGLPIHLWDERLTTRQAHQILYEAGHARQQHRRVVDQVAATLILQSFLDRNSAFSPRQAETETGS